MKNFSQTKYNEVYAACQAGGMNNTDSHECAMEHASKNHAAKPTNKMKTIKPLIKPRPGNRHDLLKLADQLESMAGDLPFCGANVPKHTYLINRAKTLRKIANTRLK